MLRRLLEGAWEFGKVMCYAMHVFMVIAWLPIRLLNRPRLNDMVKEYLTMWYALIALVGSITFLEYLELDRQRRELGSLARDYENN